MANRAQSTFAAPEVVKLRDVEAKAAAKAKPKAAAKARPKAKGKAKAKTVRK